MTCVRCGSEIEKKDIWDFCPNCRTYYYTTEWIKITYMEVKK